MELTTLVLTVLLTRTFTGDTLIEAEPGDAHQGRTRCAVEKQDP